MPTVKPVKKPVAKPKITAPRVSGMTVPLFSMVSATTRTLTLPKEIFGTKVNKSLLSQAMRVYLANKKFLPGSTKTRGEVKGSTAKIYRQKGTGRARHGGVRAPIFVGGGITFGPKPRVVSLKLPQKMKKAALISALSSKMADKKILGVAGLEKASGKTKEAAKLLKKVTRPADGGKIKSALVVSGEKIAVATRAFRNIPTVTILSVSQINAYEVMRHNNLLITKEAVEKLK